MLTELSVRDLGVVDELRLVLGPGLTAVTGETGAGKTLVVQAIDLLVGGRADAVIVRPGAAEAVVEGRFDLDGEERVVTRIVPSDGRSRAYLDGRMATAAALPRAGRASSSTSTVSTSTSPCSTRPPASARSTASAPST